MVATNIALFGKKWGCILSRRSSTKTASPSAVSGKKVPRNSLRVKKQAAMSMSGIEVDSEITTLFNDMKLKKAHKWITFKIEKKKKIIVDQKGDPNATTTTEEDITSFEELRATLTEEPRYILYDFGFTLKDGRLIQKMAFIFWCDDNAAKIGDKMIYASSKDTIKKSFTGIGLEFQANDRGDFDYNSFQKEVERKA